MNRFLHIIQQAVNHLFSRKGGHETKILILVKMDCRILHSKCEERLDRRIVCILHSGEFLCDVIVLMPANKNILMFRRNMRPGLDTLYNIYIISAFFTIECACHWPLYSNCHIHMPTFYFNSRLPFPFTTLALWVR